MSDPKDTKQPGKKLDAAIAEKLRQQITPKIPQLSYEELEQVAGGLVATPLMTDTAYWNSVFCDGTPIIITD